MGVAVGAPVKKYIDQATNDSELRCYDFYDCEKRTQAIPNSIPSLFSLRGLAFARGRSQLVHVSQFCPSRRFTDTGQTGSHRVTSLKTSQRCGYFLAEGKQQIHWTDAPTYDLRISTQAPKTDNGRLMCARARTGTGIGDVPVLTLP